MIKHLVLLSLLPLILSACSSIDTQVDYDKEVDFSKLKTYSWLPDSKQRYADIRLNSDIFKKRIYNTVNKALAVRGYKEVTQNPDFTLGYHVAIENKTSVNTMNDYYGYPRSGWGRNYYSQYDYYSAQTTVYHYEEGSLILDLVDTKSKQLIWRGSAQAEVSKSRTAKQRDELIKKAVDKLFSQLPAK